MILLEGRDISALCAGAVWGGSLTECSRSCTLTLAAALLPEVGEEVTLSPEGETVFSGVAAEVQTREGLVRLAARDRGLYLTRNPVFREYTGTPREITRQVLAEFGVEAGTLAAVNRQETLVARGELSAWQVIRAAYGGGTDYVFRMEGGAFAVRRRDSLPELTLPEVSLMRRWESLEGMINRVTLIDRRGRKLGEVEDAASRARYGTFSAALRETPGYDPYTAGRALLKPPTRGLRLTCPGSRPCVSGTGVRFTDPLTGELLRGWVEKDTHTLTPRGYTMELEVSLL